MHRAWFSVLDSKWIQGFLLVALLSIAPIQQLRGFTAVVDPDIWWHMRVGQWILQHHAFPHQGIFSAFGATHPWAAYSWAFEVTLACLVKAFGLLGVSFFVLIFQLTFVLGLFLLTRYLSRSFWSAWLLSAVAVWALDLNRVNAARPVSFTMLFFLIELALIFYAERRRNARILYWLPLLFLVWANFHIQFVYGLVLPGLWAAVKTIEAWISGQSISPQPSSAQTSPPFRPATLWVVFAACLLATLFNPYTVHVYRVIFDYMGSTYAYNTIAEFRAPTFREAADYLHLLLVAAAFFVLGRRLEPFRLALLTITTLVSFRSMRDVWFACLPAVAIIAASVRPTDADSAESAFGIRARRLIPVLAGTIVIVLLSSIDNGLSNRALFQAVHDSYPVDAAHFIQEHRLPGPLYNNFNWGGFLIGNLPDYPVSIDGRTDLYGDDYYRQEVETLMGRHTDDPALAQANTVLLPVSVPLSGMLSRSPQFKLVYQDKMAVVFVRNP
jgi:hypothetical protein